jgi:hypothetical protein
MKPGFLPQKYVIFNRKKYKLNLSFQRVMRATMLLRDSAISERARVSTGVRILSTPLSHTRSRFLPHAAKIALLDSIFTLLESAENSNKNGCVKKKNLLSLEKDGALIYGAFMQTYGIDLQKEEIDWREFCALLSSVPENTALFYVMKNRLSESSESLNDGLETLYNKLIGG